MALVVRRGLASAGHASGDCGIRFGNAVGSAARGDGSGARTLAQRGPQQRGGVC